MAIVAAYPKVTCKLSGLVTEAPAGAGLAQLKPYIDALLELFGPQRLIWGSDWPVVELAGGYDRWHALAQDALRDLDVDERAAVFGGNAVRVYLSALNHGGSARSPRPSSR
jgi:L-fuconolactonase